MKKVKWITCVLLMLAILVMLCGCGGKQAEEKTQEADKPPEESIQAEDKEKVENRSLAELYGKTDSDRIFRLNNVVTDGYGVEAAYLRDGYVLLVMRDYSEEGNKVEFGVEHLLESGKVMLFPLQEPEKAVSLSFDHLSGQYALLADGNVLAVSYDGGFTLYDSALEEVYTVSSYCGTFLGVSGERDVWFLTDDSAFALYRDGKQIRTIGAEGMRHGKYIGSRGSKVYFEMYNEYIGWTYTAIDMQDWSSEEVRTLYGYGDSCSGLINYPVNDRWYVADIGEPFLVTSFGKQESIENVWKMDDRYLISQTYQYEEATDTETQDFRIYDRENGGLCDQKNCLEISEYGITLCDFDQDILLFRTHDRTQAAKGLYVWDLRGMTADEPAKLYETVDYRVDQERVDALVQEISDQYGVTVYYDEEHLKEYTDGYELPACADVDRIGYMLVKLKECMAEYPKGFFEEIKGERMHSVVFCLCDGHIRLDTNSIEDATATVSTFEDTLRMSIDVHCWQNLRQLFLHENTHMMENRLEEEMQKITSRGYVEYWYTEMNLPDCPPLQKYIWEQTEENMKGVYEVDPENACYIDWYSKCTINEDHARIMENGISSDTAFYYTAPYIDRKSRFLNAMIRAAFPCVQKSEDVFWEQRTGIVDLYQEFPDFIV